MRSLHGLFGLGHQMSILALPVDGKKRFPLSTFYGFTICGWLGYECRPKDIISESEEPGNAALKAEERLAQHLVAIEVVSNQEECQDKQKGGHVSHIEHVGTGNLGEAQT